MLRIFASFFTSLLILSSCSKDNTPVPEPSGGYAEFRIVHQINGSPLVLDELIYTNGAGNQYMVSDLMYFLSDITFRRVDRVTTTIHKWKDIFYVDEAMDSSMIIRFYDPLPTGQYDSVSFVFGLTAEKNESFQFINPPEMFMAWPEVLGGGYHYLMLNGKWKDTSDVLQPFNLHLGIGQLYHGTTYNTDSIYAFVQNFFRVSLPVQGLEIKPGTVSGMELVMNVNSWFDSPGSFDLNLFGGAIMQRQDAMEVVRENGRDVFTIYPALHITLSSIQQP